MFICVTRISQRSDLNAFLIALLFIAAAVIAWRIRPEFAYLFPVAPAVIGSLYINWDLWAVASALLAMYFFQREKWDFSALLLGVSIAIKFFPIVLLFGVALILGYSRKTKTLTRYLAITSATWLTFNLPVALTNGEGWWRFFKLNIERGNDLGSLWYAISLLGITQGGLNSLSIVLFIVAIIGIGYFFFSVANTRSTFENFATIAFLSVAVFVTASKVYSFRLHARPGVGVWEIHRLSRLDFSLTVAGVSLSPLVRPLKSRTNTQQPSCRGNAVTD
ncbi:MAG: hypothetical protein EBW21_04840 [Actinobacteria bacterium]|nr:hypothetical protein [Actinomycetota bacterium]